MSDLVFLLLVAAGLGLSFLVFHHRFSKMVPAWKSVAQARGLRFSRSLLSGEPKIDGSSEGHAIRVRVMLPPKHGRSPGATVVRMKFASPLPLHLKLGSQNGVQGVLKFAGKTDHEVGAPAFDQKVVTSGASLEEARAFLTPERRANILHLVQSSTSARLDRTGLHCQVPGAFLSGPELGEAVENCLDAARVLGSS